MTDYIVFFYLDLFFNQDVVNALKKTPLLHFQAAACYLTAKSGANIYRLLTHDRLRVDQQIWAHSLRCHNPNHAHEKLESSARQTELQALGKGLVWVDVSFNAIGSGVKELVNALGDSSPLLILDLRSNNIVAKGDDQLSLVLLDALQENASLQHIDLRNNEIDIGFKEKITEVLVRNRLQNTAAIERLTAVSPPPVLMKLENLNRFGNEAEIVVKQAQLKSDPSKISKMSVARVSKESFVKTAPLKKIVPKSRSPLTKNARIANPKIAIEGSVLEKLFQKLKEATELQLETQERIAALESQNQFLIRQMSTQSRQKRKGKSKNSIARVAPILSHSKPSQSFKHVNLLVDNLSNAVSKLDYILSEIQLSKESEDYLPSSTRNEPDELVKNEASFYGKNVYPDDNEASNTADRISGDDRDLEQRIDSLSNRLKALGGYYSDLASRRGSQSVQGQEKDASFATEAESDVGYKRVTDGLRDDGSEFEYSEFEEKQ